MAEHELNKIVDDDGEVFNLRDSTKQPTADRVTSWGSTPSDTKYPSEKLVKDSLDGKQATLAFDGTYNASTNKAATVSTVTNAISGLDVSSVGGNGKYISSISETDGKISATATTMDTTPTASSTKAVTSGGVKSALDDKNWFKNKGPSYLQNSNAYYQCISAYTNDFSGLVKLYDVTEFFDGTIVNQDERSVFFGDVSLIRDGGNSGCKYARVCAMIGYNNASSNIILQSDDDNAYPILVKEDFERLNVTGSIGAYVISNGVAVLDTARTRSRYFVVDCSTYSRMFINAGFYSPGSYSLNDVKAYIFANDSGTVLGNSESTNFDGYVDVPAGATKLYLHTNNGYSQVSVGPTTTSPKYFLAMRYVAGWPAGTIEYFGRFYTRVTASASYSARPLLLTFVQNLAPTGTTYIPSGYVVQKTATYTTHSAVSDKLSTARKLKTNLARAADSTFDGSADQTNIPVTGTLPVGNGGTGKASVTANSYLKGNGTDALVERTYAQVRTDLGLGSVYSKDVPSSGNASTTQVVMGNDTRLSDARTPTAHTHTADAADVVDSSGDSAITDSTDIITTHVNGYSSTNKKLYRRNFKDYVWPWIKDKISSVLGLSTTGYTGNAATATKATQDSDGNAINATYFKSSGNTTLVAGAATKIGTQNGADVKLTLPTIPAAVSVKGNAESSYRTGQVNLTPANLGISATSTSVTVGSTTFNQYTHPTSAGNKHVPSGGSSGQVLGYGGSSGTATWTDLPKGYTTFSPSSETLRAYKRLAIGKTSVNLTSANAVKASFIVRIHVNYCDLGSNVTAEGMLITMMANVCFRTDQLAEMRLDAMGEARWDFEKIRPVLVSFTMQEDNITKYVVCLGFGDGTNGTTLKSFGYSYIDIMPITSDMGWEWIDGGDSTSTYDHITQMVRETGGRLGSSSGSSSLPVFVNSKGEFESVNAVNTANNMLKSLPGWTATPTDSTYLVRRDTGGAESFGQVQFSTVWAYIKGKMSSDPSGVLNGRVAGFTSNIWGTGAKRIALGYANMSSTDAWYNAIFLLKTGYNQTIGDGKSIAIMVSYNQRNSTRNVKSRVLVNNKWPLDLIPGVFTLETDNNTKLVVGFAVRDSSNNLVNLQYSEFNVIVLGKEENWTDQVTSDSVNGYNHFFETVQNPDIVVASTLPSTPEDNTLYFV